MSRWVKGLLLGVMSFFAILSLIFFAQGETKAAIGACMPLVLLAPLLLEIWRPGKYVFRKPDGGAPDHFFTRLKQFRVDHPGADGRLILGCYLILVLALVVSAFIHLIRIFLL